MTGVNDCTKRGIRQTNVHQWLSLKWISPLSFLLKFPDQSWQPIRPSARARSTPKRTHFHELTPTTAIQLNNLLSANSKKNVATGILVFDFELFKNGRSNCHELAQNILQPQISLIAQDNFGGNWKFYLEAKWLSWYK
jgi:hypothetical protein